MKRFLVLTTAAATTFLSLGLLTATSAVATSGSLPNVGGPAILKSAPHAGLPTIAANWSGYAVTSNKKFNYVHAKFTQPAVTCSGKPNRWTSNWTGLDGFNDQTVEQDGTFATCAGKGNMTPEYYAWYEMYPAGSVSVFRVKPGDVINSTVAYAKGKFTLTVGDATSGKTATKTAACSSCQRVSAEAIVERPALCSPSGCSTGFIVPLANFGTTGMENVKASTTGGTARGLGSFTNNYEIIMVQPQKNGGFFALVAVSPLDTANQSFAVKYLHSGWDVPI